MQKAFIEDTRQSLPVPAGALLLTAKLAMAIIVTRYGKLVQNWDGMATDPCRLICNAWHAPKTTQAIAVGTGLQPPRMRAANAI
jgi:hypothetical protein